MLGPCTCNDQHCLHCVLLAAGCYYLFPNVCSPCTAAGLFIDVENGTEVLLLAVRRDVADLSLAHRVYDSMRKTQRWAAALRTLCHAVLCCSSGLAMHPHANICRLIRLCAEPDMLALCPLCTMCLLCALCSAAGCPRPPACSSTCGPWRRGSQTTGSACWRWVVGWAHPRCLAWLPGMPACAASCCACVPPLQTSARLSGNSPLLVATSFACCSCAETSCQTQTGAQTSMPGWFSAAPVAVAVAACCLSQWLPRRAAMLPAT